jgi:hypothetical protein
MHSWQVRDIHPLHISWRTEERNLECSVVFFIPIPDSFSFFFLLHGNDPTSLPKNKECSHSISGWDTDVVVQIYGL